jgi:ATP-dependent protease ClpP protease subunit
MSGRLRTASTACIIGGALLSASCAPRSATTVRQMPDALVYQGALSAEANARVFQLYEHAPVKPRLLRITSSGGDVNIGMDLGEWVFRNGLDLEVVDQCASSCANYVFASGRTKFLNPDSILMWHGGAGQPGLEDQVEKLGEAGRTYMEAWKKREDAFFETIHVDKAITTYGQTAAHVVRPQNSAGYDYSIEDMARFGITNVVEKGGAWRWRELRPEFQSMVLRVDVRLPAVP